MTDATHVQMLDILARIRAITISTHVRVKLNIHTWPFADMQKKIVHYSPCLLPTRTEYYLQTRDRNAQAEGTWQWCNAWEREGYYAPQAEF